MPAPIIAPVYNTTKSTQNALSADAGTSDQFPAPAKTQKLTMPESGRTTNPLGLE